MTTNNQLHSQRVDELRKAFDAGMSLRAAAAHCGVAKAPVEGYWRRWKSRDFGGEMACRVKGSTKKVWHEEAERRQMSVQELHSYIIETIAEDGLFDAVMG